jgi:hypothetical protein
MAVRSTRASSKRQGVRRVSMRFSPCLRRRLRALGASEDVDCSEKSPSPVRVSRSHNRAGRIFVRTSNRFFKNSRNWCRPQVVLTPNHVGISGGDKDFWFGDWLMSSSSFHYALYDLVSSVGVPEMGNFPESYRPPDGVRWIHIVQAHARTIGLDVWASSSG